MVAVKLNHAGPRIVEPLRGMMYGRSLSVQSLTVDIHEGGTFHVNITNNSGQDRLLFKNTRIDYTVSLFGNLEWENNDATLRNSEGYGTETEFDATTSILEKKTSRASALSQTPYP